MTVAVPNAKDREIKKKPSITKLDTKAPLHIKVIKIENKIPDTSTLVKKTD